MSAPNTEGAVRTAADIEAELESIVDPVEVDEPQSPDSAQTAIENEATRKGWVPKDQYTGDPSRWVDASTFVDRGNKFSKNLQREVESLKKQIASFEGTKKALVQFTEERLAARDAEHKEAIAALTSQRYKAIRDGDDDLAVQIDDRIDILKGEREKLKEIPKEVEKKASDAPDMTDPVLNDWIDDGNEWFRDDVKMREYAVAMGNEIVNNGDNMVDGKALRGRKFLDLVRQRMEEDFPRRFRTAKAAAPGGRSDPVAGASASSSATRGGKTEADLPPADRELMRQFIKEGLYTKEKFLASYFAR